MFNVAKSSTTSLPEIFEYWKSKEKNREDEIHGRGQIIKHEFSGLIKKIWNEILWELQIITTNLLIIKVAVEAW